MVWVEMRWKTGEIEAFEEVRCQFYDEEDAMWEVWHGEGGRDVGKPGEIEAFEEVTCQFND